MAATGLTDVGAGDPQPLVPGRIRQHPFEQIAVASLEFVLLLQGAPRRGDPLGEGVANALQVLEAGYPRHVRAGRDSRVEDDAGESLGGKAR